MVFGLHCHLSLNTHAFRRAAMQATLDALGGEGPRRFQLLLGPRRVGKTVAMYQIVEALLARGTPPAAIAWIRLDHPTLLSADLGTLARVALDLEKGGAFLFLDEIVYADRWDLWLKTMYDERWPIRVVATGSATATLRGARRESGAGRWEERFLSPLLLSEYLAIQGRVAAFPRPADPMALLEDPLAIEAPLPPADLATALRAYLVVGGFPELATVLVPEPRHVLRAHRVVREDAVDRALYKDLRQAYRIEDPLGLEKLLYVLAAQAGGLLSTRSLAPEVGLSVITVERYVKYLEEASLVFLVPNYARSEEAVQRRGRKVYLGDAALRCAVLQLGLHPLESPREMGILLENAVAVHLHAIARATLQRLYHWRRGQDEVDFILAHPERPIAVEASWGERHGTSALRRLVEAEPRLRGRAWLVAPGEPHVTPARSGDGIGRTTPEIFLLACGAAADAAIRLSGRPG